MSTIRKRNNSYEISVSCGYDINGKQIRRTMTYKPDPNMTAKQIEKEVQRQAVLFEEQCQSGQALNNNIKFADFAEIWFNDRKKDLRPKTYERYKSMLPRINAAIGHMKLSQTAVNYLSAYKIYQMEQRLKVGDRWQDSGYIFTNDLGEPINPNTISSWFSKFMNKHSDKLPYITLHSLRHTNATLQIASGVPITTVAKRLGHTNSTTTGKIYAHAIKSADEAAAETLDNLLTPNTNRNIG